MWCIAQPTIATKARLCQREPGAKAITENATVDGLGRQLRVASCVAQCRGRPPAPRESTWGSRLCCSIFNIGVGTIWEGQGGEHVGSYSIRWRERKVLPPRTPCICTWLKGLSRADLYRSSMAPFYASFGWPLFTTHTRERRCQEESGQHAYRRNEVQPFTSSPTSARSILPNPRRMIWSKRCRRKSARVVSTVVRVLYCIRNYEQFGYYALWVSASLNPPSLYCFTVQHGQLICCCSSPNYLRRTTSGITNRVLTWY